MGSIFEERQVIFVQTGVLNQLLCNVGLYGGTKHTVATALGQVLTPEEIKRGGTGSRTNKAFIRYYQPHKREDVRVISAIKKLKKDVRGELIDLNAKKGNK
jgi:hypothetical protein